MIEWCIISVEDENAVNITRQRQFIIPKIDSGNIEPQVIYGDPWWTINSVFVGTGWETKAFTVVIYWKELKRKRFSKKSKNLSKYKEKIQSKRDDVLNKYYVISKSKQENQKYNTLFCLYSKEVEGNYFLNRKNIHNDHIFHDK